MIRKETKQLIFLTNNFELKALEIAMLYKHRWFIETFFKWIKQHLKIKSFWGRTCKCCKNPNLDCNFSLCDCTDSEKEDLN